MPPATSQPSSNRKVPAFTIALCGLALMAIAQLPVAGMALATRFEESQKVKIVSSS